MENDINFFLMEDDLNFISNGRRPQFYFQWKTTLISFDMELNLLILLLQMRRQLNIFKIEDDVNYLQFLKIF
jgi:hypothetical protein